MSLSACSIWLFSGILTIFANEGQKKGGWLVMYLMLLPHMPVLFVMMSLIQTTAGHNMAVLTVVILQLSNVRVLQTGREIELIEQRSESGQKRPANPALFFMGCIQSLQKISKKNDCEHSET